MLISSNLMTPAIVVIAYNRPLSLQRVLDSLSKAHYPAQVHVPLVISIDRGDNQAVLDVARDFTWPYGAKEVIYQPQNLGLKAHVLKCGDLTQTYGSVIVLEDDLYVSPYFYEFSQKSLAYYGDEPRVAGISLYNHRVNVHANNLPFSPIEDGTDVFFTQMASSWGQVWTESWWQAFRQWLSGHATVEAEENIPEFVRGWPKSSWLKHKIRYLVANDLFYVYPRLSLTSNFGDSGTNFLENSTLYQVPLLLGHRNWQLIPLAESAAKYDAFFEWRKEEVWRFLPELEGADLVVNCYGTKLLSKYHSEEFVIGMMDQEAPEMSFGLQMRPFEQNLIERIDGRHLQIVRNTDSVEAAEALLNQYFYQQIPMSTSIVLATRQFQKKVNAFLRR